MIRILHISDFHFKTINPQDFEEMAEKIAMNVKENLGGNKLDLIVFSGDLVFTGDKKESFESAASALFGPLKLKFGLSNDEILIAPGNHDRIFKNEMPMVQTSLDKCHTPKDLDAFCSYPEQLALSVVDQSAYNEFLDTFYSEAWDKNKLYACRKYECNGHTIGLLSLNSAWRCCGDSKNDRGKLLYPVSVLREAMGKLKGSEFIFSTEHHNLSDYQEYVTSDIEDELHEKCHIFFTGHYHKASVNVNHDAEVGMIHISAPATFNRNAGGATFGYSIVEFNEEEQKAVVCPYLYASLQFLKGRKISVEVPVSQVKIKQNDFRKLLRKRYQETLSIADDLFVNHGEGMFLRMFNDPIIKNKSVQEIITSHKQGEKRPLADIAHQEKSAIIFGYGKRGKTSLLRKIQLDALSEAILTKVIPFYLNYAQYKGGTFDLFALVRQYLELNKSDTKERFQRYSLLLLIDDLNPTDSAFMNHLKEELKKFSSSRFIAVALESMSNQIPLINFYGTDIDKYYIHDVTFREVHQLTAKWPSLAVERKREIEDKLVQVFNQMHIPLNYWSISLFLWVCVKTDNASVHNNFDLIKLYVNELLDEQNYVKDPNFSVTFDDLKSYVGALAVKIMEKEGYSLSDRELMDFTGQYQMEHVKFTDNPLDVINYLIDKGILTRDPSGKKITIRLKGVFEYFIAYHMSENSDFRDKVLNFKNSFMPFGNEWELYAGFCKDDLSSFQTIFDAVKEAMKVWTSEKDYEKIDSRIQQRVVITDANQIAAGNMLNRLEQMPEDEDFDILPMNNFRQGDTSVKPKVFLEKIDITPSNLERMIYVLARVYRNSHICDSKEMSDEMFEYILTAACNIGFKLIEEAKSYADENDENYMHLITNGMPVIVEAFFYDAIAQRNLTRVFEEKLQTYMASPKDNQMRIFMMAMLLLDIDAVKYQDKAIKALEVIDNNVLRFSILQKSLINTIRDSENSVVKNALRPIRETLTEEFFGKPEQKSNLEEMIRKEKLRKAAIRNTTKE